MINSITDMIIKHLELLDESDKLTGLTLVSIKEEDIDEIEATSDNRERLFSIISKVQEIIETKINTLPNDLITSDFVEIVKCWGSDLDQWILRTQEADFNIIELLESFKQSTTKEIASLFKTKERFKGYNLNNVSKL
jgi:hypothetical protein